MTRFTDGQITARLCQIEEIYIETAITSKARVELTRRLASHDASRQARRKPKLTWLLAPSGVGKTTLVETFVADINTPIPGPLQHHDQDCRVLYINLPTPCTIKAMTVEILDGLQDPLSHKHSSTGDNTGRIRALVAERKIRLIILDEFQHLIDPERDKVITSSAQWLKRTIDVTRVPVVCVGLPDSVRIYSQDKQIQRRTTKIITMRPFGPNELDEFRGFLQIYELELGFAEPSRLSAKQTASAILRVSEGLIGQVEQLIVEAADISMRREQGPDAITVDDLAEAFDQLPFEGKNPFTLNYREKASVDVGPALNSHARNAPRRTEKADA